MIIMMDFSKLFLISCNRLIMIKLRNKKKYFSIENNNNLKFIRFGFKNGIFISFRKKIMVFRKKHYGKTVVVSKESRVLCVHSNWHI